MISNTRKWALIFCTPAFIIILAVAGWPLLRTFMLSLTDASLDNLDSYSFVGLDNYYELIIDPEWWNAVKNTVVFTVTSVSCEVVLGLGIALTLHSSFRGRGLLRAAILIPWAIPTVVSAKMWSWMLNDIYGIINHILISFSLIEEKIAWLAEDRYALLVIIAVDVWKTTPFAALLILAALQSIPTVLYESAQVDGANRFQMFRHITLPMIRPAITVVVLFRSLDALRVFDLPYIMTSNSEATATMSIFARENLIEFQNFGYGSASAFMIFCVIAVLLLIYLRFGRKYLGVE